MTTLNELSGVVAAPPYQIKKLLALPMTGPDPTLLYGVELEIEGLNPDVLWDSYLVAGIHHTEDGSLRGGREFITAPMKMRELDYTLRQFFLRNKFTEENYSERCSVHVHTNVGDMTYDQLRNVFLLYQMFEKVLFGWIGDDRENNIFCAPWYTSLLGKNLLHKSYTSFGKLLDKLSKWQKYTAVNLLPIRTIGTIEWRHMAGTPNVERILLWCNLIGCILRWAKDHTYEEVKDFLLTLNTTSRYNELCAMIFQQYSPELMGVSAWKEKLEEGVLDAKYLIGDFQNIKETTKQERDPIVQNYLDTIDRLHLARRVVGQNPIPPAPQEPVRNWAAMPEAIRVDRDAMVLDDIWFAGEQR